MIWTIVLLIVVWFAVCSVRVFVREYEKIAGPIDWWSVVFTVIAVWAVHGFLHKGRGGSYD